MAPNSTSSTECPILTPPSSDPPSSPPPSGEEVKLPKPEIPYKQGHVLSLRQHVPPPFMGQFYRSRGIPPPKRVFLDEEPENVLQEEADMFDESREGSWLDATEEIVVKDTIRVGKGRPSHVVRCKRASNSAICVAKFYYPLYATEGDFFCGNDPHGDRSNNPDADLRRMDADYSTEAAAYKRLDPHLEGSAIPVYYGSWTTSFRIETTRGPATRVVALILMEYVPGTSLFNVEHEDLTDAQRLAIMAKIFRAEALISGAGVEHADLAPRTSSAT